MNIQKYIQRIKKIYDILLNFVDNEDEIEDNFYFDSLISFYTPQNKDDFRLFLHLLSEISKNHHREYNFVNKIERILLNFKNEIMKAFSNTDIFKLFKTNKRILFFLFKNKFIIPDKSITILILHQSKTQKKFHRYFYPQIKSFVDKKWSDKIEKELIQYDTNILEKFDDKCKTGENDNYICNLIRNDSIEEFIIYVNRSNLSLSQTTIKASIFETNSFLIKRKEITLIEYAAFFGSIQIFQYLRLNNVELKPSLWLFVIHSKSADLIHLLEENHVEPDDKTYNECLYEAIKCHHNDIAEYIQNNLITEKSNKVIETSFHFYNFSFLSEDLKEELYFEYSCKYNYIDLFKLSLSIQMKNRNSIKKHDIQCLQAAAYRNNVEIVNLLLLNLKFEISSYLFKQAEKLTEISIPSSVTEIGSYAFDGCTSLKKISLPMSLKSIGYSCFYGCTSLTKISIPSSVSEIGYSAFEGCSSLKKVIISSSSKLKSIKDKTFSNCLSLMKIIIPDSVESIGKNCFKNCKSIQNILISNFVKSIGGGAFSECSSLTEIEIPSSITEIEIGTFESCTSLNKIKIPYTVNKIGNFAFSKCQSLIEISIQSCLLKSIKKNVFDGCSSLSQISIPSSVTKIKRYAFNECTSLKEIAIPFSVTEIGSFAFNGCKALNNINVPDLIVYIGEGAFKNCSSLIEINIPSLITTISDSVFDGCSLLKKIEIPASVITIGSYSFYGCTSLEKIEFPSSLKRIGSYSFSGCTSLTQILIPSSVNFLGENAFEGCSSITNSQT